MDNLKSVYTGIIVKETEGYSALCPELDIASEGETIAKAKNNILDAVILYVETAIESNLPIKRPMPSEEYPRIIRHSDIAEIFRMNVEMSVEAYA